MEAIKIQIQKLLIPVLLVTLISAVDLNHGEIQIVTNGTRYLDKNPGIEVTRFNKLHHVKGNYYFSAGERISGDRLILTFTDEIQFTKLEDIEVELKYPANGKNGATISAVDIYVDISQKAEGEALFTAGGIRQPFGEILLTCNNTDKYEYELFIYGY